jgi:DNA-binding NarL/FixJ family response regulator
VLVVDDFEPFRRLICTILQNHPEVQVVSEATHGLEAVEQAEKFQPDLILLDIGLPKLNGIEAARRICKFSPKSKILFVSQESSPYVIQEALRVGALGYVVKLDVVRELSEAVDAVLQGRIFVGSNFRSVIFPELPM